MDNKPLEEEAENCIKLALAKANIKYLKPNYDTNGTDLVLLNPVSKHLARQVIVQSKGRNVTSSPSNVVIKSEYVASNFICFLYVKVEADYSDNLYIFFSEDIKKWSINGDNYTLSIPQGFKSNRSFIDKKFSYEIHIPKILKLLNETPIFRQSYIEFEKMGLTEVLFEMWKKYESFPDLNMVKKLYDDFYTLSGSYAEDIFLIYTIGIHAENLEYRSLDHFMQNLYEARNIGEPISNIVKVKNPENIKLVTSDMAIVYSKLKFGQVLVDYDGIEYKALYCYIGDREDHVEALLFDNGEYVAYGKRV
jgi:hypothetical protein